MALCNSHEFNGYWKDVGTLSSYWEANMELIDIVPEFNLYIGTGMTAIVTSAPFCLWKSSITS